jgi:hypothetical protein
MALSKRSQIQTASCAGKFSSKPLCVLKNNRKMKTRTAEASTDDSCFKRNKGLFLKLFVGFLVVVGTGIAVGSHKHVVKAKGQGNNADSTSTVPAKLAIQGLVTMGDTIFFASGKDPNNSFAEALVHQNVYSAVVIQVTWKQLQPNGPNDFNTSAIDNALAAIELYNNNTNVTLNIVGKLRVYGGSSAPNWVKVLNGGPLTLIDPAPGPNLTVGLFWKQSYRDYWKNLTARLADMYDQNPLIQEVSVGSCMTKDALPFLMLFTPSNTPILKAAGYTDDQGMQCLRGVIDDYDSWQYTAVDLTFNPWRYIGNGTTAQFNLSFSYEMIDSWKATFGTRGMISNHQLDVTNSSAELGLLFSYMAKKGAPIGFQAVSSTVNWNSTFYYGLSQGMTELEVYDTTAACTNGVCGSASIVLPLLQSFAASLNTTR